MTLNRFVDSGAWLSDYADEVRVRCPRCDRPGVVRTTRADRTAEPRFRCGGCALTLGGGKNAWHGPIFYVGHRPCSHCGHRWLTPKRFYSRKPSRDIRSMKVECPRCERSTMVPVEPCRVYPADGSIDPHFGLRLQLTTATRFGPIWAYNPRHLTDYRGYIGATLRERNEMINRSAFARLPAWIKAAKNRALVERALARLAKMAA